MAEEQHCMGISISDRKW